MKKFRTFHMQSVGKDLKVRSACGRLRNEHTKNEIGLVGKWDLVNCFKCLNIRDAYPVFFGVQELVEELALAHFSEELSSLNPDE